MVCPANKWDSVQAERKRAGDSSVCGPAQLSLKSSKIKKQHHRDLYLVPIYVHFIQNADQIHLLASLNKSQDRLLFFFNDLGMLYVGTMRG